MSAVFDALIKDFHKGVNPYAGFPVDQWETDDFGFMGDTTFFDQTLDQLRPNLVVEVGSLLGQSARYWAIGMKARGIEGAVLCIDTWLAEYILWSIPEHRERLKIKYGRPEMYNTFMANNIKYGLQDMIVPLPMASPGAARYMASLDITAPVIYIDASHEQGDVYLDLWLYWDRVQHGGVLMLDDYQPDPMFVGLVKDVDRFVTEHQLKLEVYEAKARIFKL